MGTTGCPDPRIDRSPSCCCSPFECQLCCQSRNSSPAVASSISRGRNHAADRPPAVPRDRARRSLRASRRAAILRDWPAEPAPAQVGVVEPTAVLLLHCDERRHRRRPPFCSRQGSRRTLPAGSLEWRRRSWCRQGLVVLALLRSMSRLPFGGAHRFGADALAGHACLDCDS